MRTLASIGILTEDAEHRFALTPLGEAMKSGATGSARTRVVPTQSAVNVVEAKVN